MNCINLQQVVGSVGNHRNFYAVINSVQLPRTAYRNGIGSRSVVSLMDESTMGSNLVILHILDKQPFGAKDYPDLQRFHVLRAVAASVQRDRFNPKILDIRVFSANCIQVVDPLLLGANKSTLDGDKRAMELAAWVCADPEFICASRLQTQVSSIPASDPLASSSAENLLPSTPLVITSLQRPLLSGASLPGSSGTQMSSSLDEINQVLQLFGVGHAVIPRLGSLVLYQRYDLLPGIVTEVVKGASVQRKAHITVTLQDDFGAKLRMDIFDSNCAAQFPVFPRYHLLLARQALVSEYLGRIEAKVSSVKDILLLDPRRAVHLPGRMGELARHADAQREIEALQLDKVILQLEEVVPGLEELTPGLEKVVPGLEEVVSGLEEVVPGLEEVVPSLEEVTPRLEEVGSILICRQSNNRMHKLKVETCEQEADGGLFSDSTIMVVDPRVMKPMPGDDHASQQHAEILAQCLLPAPALEPSAQFPRHKLVCQAKEGDVFTAIVRVLDNKRTNTGVVLTISDGSRCLGTVTASLSVPRRNRKLQRVKKNYYVAIEDVVCEAGCKLRAMETSQLTPLISSQPELRALRRRLMCSRRSELNVSPSKCFAPLMFVTAKTFPRYAGTENLGATETFSQHAPSPRDMYM